MSDNWKGLQSNKVDGKLTNGFERKLNHLKNVILNPDKYNTNIATKDELESLTQQLEELGDKLANVIKRIDKLEDKKEL